MGKILRALPLAVCGAVLLSHPAPAAKPLNDWTWLSRYADVSVPLAHASPAAPTSRLVEPCEGLRTLLDLAAPRIAEHPDDRNLQVRAARLVRLQSREKVSVQVLDGLRQALADAEYMRRHGIQPAILTQEVAATEQDLANVRASLDRERAGAMTAGYLTLADKGGAQSVISNVLWRRIAFEARHFSISCGPDSPGQHAAREFLSGIAIGLADEDVLNESTIRDILREEVRKF
jgi:hypothetical protein